MYHQSFNSIGDHIYNGYVYQNTKQHDNFHNSFEYIFVWKGNISVTANNVKVNLAENDMMLIAPNIVHSLEVSPVTGSEYFISVFSKDFISEFKNDELFYTAIKFKADKTVEDYLAKDNFDWSELKGSVRDNLAKYLVEQTKRRPAILPVVMEVR